MFYLVNERTHPEMAMALGLVIMAMCAIYFLTSDSVRYHDWPLVKAERIDDRRSSYVMEVNFRDLAGNSHTVKARYNPRDWRELFPPQAGEEIALRYNPADPDQVVISFRYPYRIILLCTLVCGFFYGLIYFIQGMRHAR